MKAFLLAGLGLTVVLATSVSFSEEKAGKADSPAKLMCPVAGTPIDKSKSSDYGGGIVYFCCAKCKAKFDADNAKFSTKANLQLAASGQAKQTKCPLTGDDLDVATKVDVGGVEVQFCCNDCKAKVTAAKPDKQIQMVFANKAFSKAFKIVKDKDK